MNIDQKKITEIILKYHPKCQAIYLFGSFAFGLENKDSDVDIAILLSYQEAKEIPTFLMSDLYNELANYLNRDIDLINLRTASNVLQNQVVSKGSCIFYADKYSKDEFEMLSLSFYQKLNEERREILEDILGNKL